MARRQLFKPNLGEQRKAVGAPQANDSLQAAGLDEYEFIAVLDSRTTPRCQALDGTMHLLEEYSVGTNAPPMHPRCRSTISAVLGEKTGTRIARNKEGKNIQVPASMTYPDYKKVYLDKSMTLEQWREKDKIRAAAEKEKFKEQDAHGADIIRRLANGEKVTPKRLINSGNNGKIQENIKFNAQRFGVYEDQVNSHGGSGNIKPDLVHSSHNGNPRKSEPLQIIEHKNHDGKIDKRAFYDAAGLVYLEIHTTNHNFPKTHPFGTNGEHAHNIKWIDEKATRPESGRELTTQEREDNADIL